MLLRFLIVSSLVTASLGKPVYAYPMTMEEFEALCRSKEEPSSECRMYLEGLLDGFFKGLSVKNCDCPTDDDNQNTNEQSDVQDGETWFVLQHPFQSFGACVSRDSIRDTLEARALIERMLKSYFEQRQAAESFEHKNPAFRSYVHLNPPSTFLYQVLISTAEKTCAED